MGRKWGFISGLGESPRDFLLQSTCAERKRGKVGFYVLYVWNFVTDDIW